MVWPLKQQRIAASNIAEALDAQIQTDTLR